jgi:Ni/Fe-hydrogenase subunit HybB-like protein
VPWRKKLYTVMAFGWRGTANEWRHFTKAYLYLAALATPLVLSVHSVVSWDFAMSIVPGWHTTIFAPYFVAGAIFSGLAMVITLIIPIRKIFGLEAYFTPRHFDAMAKMVLVTGHGGVLRVPHRVLHGVVQLRAAGARDLHVTASPATTGGRRGSC